MNKIKIAPSLLSADFSRLSDEIKAIEGLGAEMLHIDIMDGHFVPNITIGPAVVASVRKCAKLIFDVHLMIERPLQYIQQFSDAGADLISFHIESKDRPQEVIKKIRSFGKLAALAINPPTPLDSITHYLDDVDMVLIMSVNPGFSGQGFINSVLPKISELRKVYSKDIQVDGGITNVTAALAVREGANILAAGSYIFSAPDRKERINSLRNCLV